MLTDMRLREEEGLLDPYGLEYQDSPDVLTSDVSPHPEEKLTISPLRVLLGQTFSSYTDSIADFCVKHRVIVGLLCIVVVFVTLFLLRKER